MTIAPADARTLAAAQADCALAVREFDEAREWLGRVEWRLMPPLAVEVWLFDQRLEQVLLVKHRWRVWVPPGGAVEPGETPREAAARELHEETGLRVHLLALPAAVAVRSYHPEWSATLGLSYAAIADRSSPLTPEIGQPVAWTSLEEGWQSLFGEDRRRIRWHAGWLADLTST
ncbi:MAG: NUDIX hydrolase [Geodermatophilaceae bacterium]